MFTTSCSSSEIRPLLASCLPQEDPHSLCVASRGQTLGFQRYIKMEEDMNRDEDVYRNRYRI